MVEYDVIIIGAGSIGVPTALSIAQAGLKTLVLDQLPSVAQGDNKHAIGGIRATHSQKSKMWLCQRSIDIFSTWEQKYGDDIWWEQGGYCFLAFSDEDEQFLRKTASEQKELGLNIDYIDTNKIKELIPGITELGLRGGTYSPGDGNASPLKAVHSMFKQSCNEGAQYEFKQTVINIEPKSREIITLKTASSTFHSRTVINAAGWNAGSISRLMGCNLPIFPESHEAGITEPVKKFFSPMIVDIQPKNDLVFGNSKNYYFYQNREGKIIFCLTPNPSIIGVDRRETSSFLPQISKRMVNLLPRLRNVKRRRTWRGLYPMTPDGNPIVGSIEGNDNFINAAGMCGQGFMLGPGLGDLIARMLLNKLSNKDAVILSELSYKREYCQEENLK
jgi:sarcosine oxidase subunit beta